MRSKLWYLTKISLKKKMKTKWFLVVNLILAIAIIGIINLDRVISFFGGDFDKPLEVLVLDETNLNYEVLESSFASLQEKSGEDDHIVFRKVEGSISSLKEALEDDEVLVALEEDDVTYLKASVISEGKINTVTYQTLLSALNATRSSYVISQMNLDPTLLAQITESITVDRIVLGEEKDIDEQMDTVMSSIFPTIILPFFMLTIFLVQMIGAEICEEKTTRSMEIIISNVSPKTHFFSKILSGNLFVISQGFLLILYVLIGFLLRGGSNDLSGGSLGELLSGLMTTLSKTGLLSQLGSLIPLTLVLMLLSFLAYSLVAGILASMTVNMEDYQQIQTPMMMITMVGYFLSIMSGMFDGSTFIRVLSYVPFLSAMLSPALLILGQISIFDVMISIGVLVLFNVIILKRGLKIYKLGILNYSTDKVWNRIRKAVKTKNV